MVIRFCGKLGARGIFLAGKLQSPNRGAWDAKDFNIAHCSRGFRNFTLPLSYSLFSAVAFLSLARFVSSYN
jgi:hypothetical protein